MSEGQFRFWRFAANGKLAAARRLAASMAHEINNPLEAGTNSLYSARQDKTLPAETRAYLELADKELRRVAHVTTQTLQFHRQSKFAGVEDLGRLWIQQSNY